MPDMTEELHTSLLYFYDDFGQQLLLPPFTHVHFLRLSSSESFPQLAFLFG